MTILWLALLGMTLFWQGQMATALEELPSVPLHRCCSGLLHIYQTFSSLPSIHLSLLVWREHCVRVLSAPTVPQHQGRREGYSKSLNNSFLNQVLLQ